MRVLVTGGAGYIGSHTVVALAHSGHDVVVADNYTNSKPAVLDRLAELIGRPVAHERIDLRDPHATRALMAGQQIDAVIHFAALKAVGESVAKPLDYYDNNLSSTLSVLTAMRDCGVRRLVFSSSATVYGEHAEPPFTEDMPLEGTHPYGRTKVMIEQVLADLAAADDTWRFAALRYFNPIGAHESGRLGEDPEGIPNNLVPFLAQVAVGRREHLSVFGGDYPTADGTCERDYIHVTDLADGHVRALERLDTIDRPLSVWNLGTGTPTSVLEMVRAFSAAVGRELPYRIVGRRPGDIPVSYADPRRAEADLGWRAEKSVATMCADAWRWQDTNPHGYPS